MVPVLVQMVPEVPCGFISAENGREEPKVIRDDGDYWTTYSFTGVWVCTCTLQGLGWNIGLQLRF